MRGVCGVMQTHQSRDHGCHSRVHWWDQVHWVLCIVPVVPPPSDLDRNGAWVRWTEAEAWLTVLNQCIQSIAEIRQLTMPVCSPPLGSTSHILQTGCHGVSSAAPSSAAAAAPATPLDPALAVVAPAPAPAPPRGRPRLCPLPLAAAYHQGGPTGSSTRTSAFTGHRCPCRLRHGVRAAQWHGGRLPLRRRRRQQRG